MRERLPAAVVTALFILLAAGLFYTQIVRYGYYSRMAKNNSIRVLPIDGPRGTIYDRMGRPIVTNRLAFDVALIYSELRDRSELARLLGSVLGMSRREIIDALVLAGAKPYTPVPIARDVGKERSLVLEEATFDTPGLVIQTRSKRSYPHARAAAHVVGYLGEVTATELEGLEDDGYRTGDLLGRGGLEKYYEPYLRGRRGGTQVEIDNRGRQVRVLGIKEPLSGRDLHLSVDLPLQIACDKLLGPRRGAIVALDPRTGAVRALVSHPSFDPGVFVRPDGSDERVALIGDTRGRPLVDRAISGLYAPGSVFKIVTAAAALETKAVTRASSFFCSGSYRLGRADFGCWKAEGHGAQDIIAAITHSCNVFFYNAGRKAGVDALENTARAFGYGKATGIDLPDEAKGIAPGRTWKRLARNEDWYEGDTLNYSIGQGYLLVTPIQVAVMTAAIANGGLCERPFVVSRIGKTDVVPGRARRVGIRASTVDAIREGMRGVTADETGTGRRARVDGVPVAGKTGTAQNPQGRTHAWFTGFAPYADPKLCVVVFLENGGKGGVDAAEAAGGVFAAAKEASLI